MKTPHRTANKTIVKLVSIVAVLGLLTAGCSGGAASDDGGKSASAAPLADKVPAKFVGKTIHGVVGDNNPPLYLRDDSGKVVGVTTEIANAAADLLGLKIDSEVQPFDTVIAGLQSSKYDIGIYAIDLLPERVKILDLVPYLLGGYALLAYDTGAAKIPNSVEELCGLKLGGIVGNAGVASMKTASDDCVKRGKTAIDVQEYKDQAAANLAVQSGQLDAAIISVMTGGYLAKKDAKWKLVGPQFVTRPSGMAFTKDSGLADAFAAAINELISNGTYKEILDKYGITAAKIDKVTVNPTS